MGALSYLARRFIAGENTEEALRAVKVLNARNILTSLDILGEDVESEVESRACVKDYLELLGRIQEEKVKSNVSLKLTQMGLDIGDDFCFSLVESVVARARELGNFVRIDMEGSAYTQRTIDVYKKLFARHPQNVGLVLQAYLHRSESDARDFAALKAPIRVCKGAYKESASIAFKDMDAIRESYKKMVEILVLGGSKVGIATHDEALIQWALEWTQRNRISQTQFEFQFLYGLKRKRAVELASMGYAVRSYIPFGTHWMPYFFRRLRERKENVFFVLKGLFET